MANLFVNALLEKTHKLFALLAQHATDMFMWLINGIGRIADTLTTVERAIKPIGRMLVLHYMLDVPHAKA